MNIHSFNGKKTVTLAVVAETYDDIKNFILEQSDVDFGKPADQVTTADMALLGWHKNPVFVGWFKPVFEEVKGHRQYKPCYSLYIQKSAG